MKFSSSLLSIFEFFDISLLQGNDVSIYKPQPTLNTFFNNCLKLERDIDIELVFLEIRRGKSN